MAVRNFYIVAWIDGRKTPIRGGPRSKDGGFTLAIKQRNKGEIDVPITIQGTVMLDGNLQLTVYNEDKELIESYSTQR